MMFITKMKNLKWHKHPRLVRGLREIKIKELKIKALVGHPQTQKEENKGIRNIEALVDEAV